MNRKTIAAGFATLIMAAPAFALAQSASTSVGVTTDVQAQIQALLSQIQALQQQVKMLIASSTMPAMHDMEHMMASSTTSMMGHPCVAISRDLSIGSEGDDVRQLQDILAQDPEDGFTASSTGVFGPLTAKAMMHFQMRMGIASSSTGFVGPLTRNFFKEHCGGSDNGIGNGGMDNGNHGGVMIRIVSGTITGSDSSSITVQGHDNSTTVTVNITASTTIMVASTSSSPVVGTIANLTNGSNVIVEGQNSSNGSVNATRITVGTGAMPMLPMMNGNGGDMHGGMQMHMDATTTFLSASSTDGVLHGLMQFFNPFLPGGGQGDGHNSGGAPGPSRNQGGY
ncbi:MAG TPA: DUF5666 domain-containing protein [Candidatus Paceibacterota bacterium]|nr:DUF5666 domain-containing protein [Candidatus Paceibacterota bacterium]